MRSNIWKVFIEGKNIWVNHNIKETTKEHINLISS